MGILPRIPSIAVLVSAVALSSASKQWKQSENESLKAGDIRFWDRFLQDRESSIIGSETSRSPSAQVPLPPVRPSPPPIPTSGPVPLPSTPLPPVLFPLPTPPPTSTSLPLPISLPPTPPITTSVPLPLPSTPPPTTTSLPLPIPLPPTPPITTSVPLPLPSTPPPTTTSVPVPLPSTPPPTTTSVPVPLPSTPTPPITTSVPLPLPSTPPPTTTSVPVPLATLSPVQATAVPSLACFINASITCFDESGVPCSQLVNEGRTCSTGNDIVAATFTIASHTCGESRTSQDNSFACEDSGPLPPGTSNVLVSCRDEVGVEFFKSTVALGSAVAVKDNTAAALPDAITCVIIDENSGSAIQIVTFETSGNIDLFLNDRFGMMELVSCDVTGQPPLSCISPIIYTYELENIGGVVANVTSLVRSRDGDSANLLVNIELANPLSPGDAVATTETDEIDLCVGTTSQTMITAGANQVTGAFCESSATYDLESVLQCRIDTHVDCSTQKGLPCELLQPLESDCSGDLNSLTFTYTASPCDVGANGHGSASTCDDSNGGLVGQEIFVSCAGADGVPIGIPSNVTSGDIFTIAFPGDAPSQLRCNLSTLDGTPLQVVSIDLTSGVALTDKFGGLTVEACNANDVEKSCKIAVSWTVESINIGSSILNLTSVEVARGDIALDLSDQVVGVALSPGESIKAMYQESYDRCVGSSTTVRVVGASSSGANCSSVERYDIPGTAEPTTVPTAAPTQSTNIAPQPSVAPNTPTSSPPTEGCLEVKIGCLPPFEGADCNNIPMMVAKCEDPPSQMVMRYNGGDCSGSFNIQPPTLFKCFDSQGGPPVIIGTPSYITASGLGGKKEEFFSGFVDVGEEFTVIAQSQVSADMNILIFDPTGLNNTDEITTAGRLLQNITLHTSCLDFLFLNDRFGTVQLVEFVNERQGRVTSFQNVTMTYTMEIAKSADLASVALTGLEVTSNIDFQDGVTRDLSQKVVGSSVVPNSTVVVEDTYIIDLSQRKTYSTSAVVLGQSENGVFCSGKDSYQFTTGSPLPPIFPTQAPSSLPTITPFPTPDPSNSPCEVEASISCALSSGRRCNLKSPAGSTCIGSDPTFLQFMYSPTSFCKGNNTSTNFQCDDFNRDLERPESVYIRIGKGDQDIWFSEVVSTGRVIDVPVSGESMRIAISTVGSDGGPGVILQESRMSLECSKESALTLLSYFGNLQLVGYENLELGLQQVFANVKITYVATNDGELDMQLIGAFGSSPFTGFQEFLETDGSPLSRDESISFVEEFTLNLDATTGSDFQFTFLAQGRGSISNLGCDDTAAYTLTII